MIVWDTGTWAPMEDVEKSLRTGAFKFRLAGEKLNGGWMLARLKPKPGETRTRRTGCCSRSATLPPMPGRRHPADAAGKRQVRAADRGACRDAETPLPKRPARLQARRAAGRGQGGRAGAHRAAARQPGRAPARGRRTGCTRSSSTATAPWPIVAEGDGPADHPQRPRLDASATATCRRGFATLPCQARRCIDGEIVVLDDEGISRFARCRTRCRQGAGNKLVFYAFDLLHLDGWDLTAGAARAAQGAARASCSPGMRAAARRSSSATTSRGDGDALYDRASELGLEGIVSKRGNGALPERPLEDLDQDQGAADRRFRHRRLHRLRRGRGPGGAGARRMGRTASCVYRGKVGTGFDAATLPAICWRGWSRCGAGAAPLDGAPKDDASGCGRCFRRISTMPTAPPTIRCATRCFMGCARSELSTRGGRAERKRLISEADLADDLGDQPDAAAVRQVRADQARHRRLLCAASATSCCRTSSAGRCRWCAARPAGRRTASSSAMPSPACRPRSRRSRRPTPKARTRPISRVEDAKGYLALAQFGVVEFHCLGRLRQRLDKPGPGRLRPRSRRGHRLARGGRGGGAHRGRAGRRWGWCRSSRRPAARASMSSCR